MQEEQTAKENLKTCHDVLLSVLVTQDCQHSRIPNMRPLCWLHRAACLRLRQSQRGAACHGWPAPGWRKTASRASWGRRPPRRPCYISANALDAGCAGREVDIPKELACGLPDMGHSNFLEPAHSAPAASAAGMPASRPPYSTPLLCQPATRDAPHAHSVCNPGQTSARLPAAQGHACASPPAHALVRVRVHAGGIQHMPGAHWRACPAPGLRCQVPLREAGRRSASR